MRTMTTAVALSTFLLSLTGCGGSGDKKSTHAEVVAAAKAVCAERDAIQENPPDDSLSDSEKAKAVAKLTENYNKTLNRFLGLSAADANDQQLIDQLNTGYKAIKDVNPRDEDSLDRIRKISDQVSKDVDAAGEDFACMNS